MVVLAVDGNERHHQVEDNPTASTCAYTHARTLSHVQSHSGESIADAAKHATSSAAKTVDPEREDKSTIQKAKEAIGMD